MRKKQVMKRISYYLFLCMSMLFICALFGCRNKAEENGDGSLEQEKSTDLLEYKELHDPRGTVLESTATGETKPQIVETKYETTDIVIADIIPTEMGYAVDPTGETDSTDGIQAALYDCYYAGGGTVFLPSGNYAISDTIYVPPYVALRGDWQDPDEGTEYGTIISVWMEPDDCVGPGAFMLGGSGGVIGLTIYYPLQTIENVLPYPCAFYVNGIDNNFMLSTVKNVTVINGYRGIGTGADNNHECLTIENYKGTFLSAATDIYNQTDAGTLDNVVISNKYWKEAAADCMNAVSESAIDAYTLEHAVGLRMGGLDWTQFRNITIKGCSIGIEIVSARRVGFDGAMIDINIENCGKGMVVNSLEERSGLLIARSKIKGILENNWIGTVKLCDVAVDEIKERAKNTVIQDESDLSGYEINYDKGYVKPKPNLLVAELEKGTTTDVSSQLQTFLNEMSAKGGGVVYVPGGTYRLDHAITVPANVELRGSSSVATREQITLSNGTLFLCYYGDDASSNAETDPALITLAGENAGLNGIRIIYPQNGPYDADLNTTYTVRGTANGVYVVNCMITASGYGVDMRGCDNHFIERVVTCCYYNAFRVGGKGGVLRGCLQNGTVLVRLNSENLENWIVESNMGADLYDPILRVNSEFIIAEDATDQLIYEAFMYGGKSLVVNRNSQNTLVANVGADNLGRNSAMLVVDGGSMTLINAIRYNGYSYELKAGTLNLYNRVTYDVLDEATELLEK